MTEEKKTTEVKKERLLPIGDRVLIERVAAHSALSAQSRLVLPEESQQVLRPYHGLVLEVGPDVKNVQPGDVVAYARFSGVEIMRTSAYRRVLNIAQTEEPLTMLMSCDIMAKVV